ncbi:hypothetical protein [Haloflavibacter putidus]|uniref:Uncharacterized protein n=1 Tax=Haloflavibacter putidus TaxID=2576776 RepID=A0A508A1Y4_9FLAO|nr:hypothetical protein [Haloflavibacter putidus]TQD39832.1 hypothetical protein FKR84_04895 [Haloflavibacter putidus]
MSVKAKDVIAVKGFWKSVAVLGIIFIIGYNLIDLLFSYGFNWDAFVAEKLTGKMAWRFIAASLVGGFIYGFIVVFLQFRSKLKQEEKQR